MYITQHSKSSVVLSKFLLSGYPLGISEARASIIDATICANRRRLALLLNGKQNHTYSIS